MKTKTLIACVAAPSCLLLAASRWKNEVTIVTEPARREIRANGIADHEMGEFPRRGNPNSISPQSYVFTMTMAPKAVDKPADARFAFFGVAVNGVPFEPGTAEFWMGDRQWNYEAMTGFTDLGLDEHNAHVQPNGAYHYHGLPGGLVKLLGGDERKMLLIGYAADGFPIYASRGHSDAKDAKSPLKAMRSSWRLKQGARPDGDSGPGGKRDGHFTDDFEFVPGSGDLDECNGRFGVAPEHPEGIYHYHITAEFPFIGRSWRGEPDPSFFKKGPPPGGGGRKKGGPRFGPPPPKGRPF